jgi:hypothetical protein
VVRCAQRPVCWDYVNSETVCATWNIVRQVLTKWQRTAGKKHSPGIAKLMKADRDANFIERTSRA